MMTQLIESEHLLRLRENRGVRLTFLPFVLKIPEYRLAEGHEDYRMKERREKQIQEELAVTPSTGDVFADLGLPDAEELYVKSNLAMKINNIIEKRHLSQTQAAEILGIPQPKPKVSMIQQGKLRGISLEKIMPSPQSSWP